jgi:2-hydroxy-3-oxopropionate reductase
MSRNLLAAGHQLVVHSRSRGPVDTIVGEGAAAASTPAEVAKAAEVVITMLPDSPDVEDVVLGSQGVFDGAQSGLLLIDMSTIRPDVSQTIAREGQARGVRVLDAPVSGGEKGAVEGTLSIMVGGADDDVAAAMPILEVLGSVVSHVGPAGAGQTVKAANQIVVAGIIEVVSEAIVFLEAADIPRGPALAVLAGGLAGNRVIDIKADAMCRREFTPGFRAELHLKDLQIALATAQQNKAVVPLTAQLAQMLTALCATGRGGLDHGALIDLVSELSGRLGKQTAA